jgi:hypothetical protein
LVFSFGLGAMSEQCALLERLQLAHDPLDPVFEGPQVFLHPALRGRSFLERYAAGEVGTYTYLAGVGDEYVVVFYRPLGAMECQWG